MAKKAKPPKLPKEKKQKKKKERAEAEEGSILLPVLVALLVVVGLFDIGMLALIGLNVYLQRQEQQQAALQFAGAGSATGTDYRQNTAGEKLSPLRWTAAPTGSTYAAPAYADMDGGFSLTSGGTADSRPYDGIAA